MSFPPFMPIGSAVSPALIMFFKHSVNQPEDEKIGSRLKIAIAASTQAEMLRTRSRLSKNYRSGGP
jgi:hypothetical protein